MKRIFLLVLFISMIYSLSFAQSPTYFQDIVVSHEDAIWVDSRGSADLDTLITAIGSDVRDIYIAQAEVITQDIPANITLHFRKDGSLTNNTGITISGEIDAPEDQSIFNGSGDYDFGTGLVLKSGWFPTIYDAINLTNDDSIGLKITGGHQTLSTNVAVGNNVTLIWESTRNRIIADTGVTLSNIHDIQAGEYQLFAGAGDFDFVDGTYLRDSWFWAFRSAITYIGSAEVRLVTSESENIDTNITIPENIEWELVNNAQLNILAGRTLTIETEKIIASGIIIDPTTAGNIVVDNSGMFDIHLFDPATIISGLVAFNNSVKAKLSKFDDLDEARDALNPLNIDCRLVIDESDTMDENVSFDEEVVIEIAEGNIITTTGFTLTLFSPENLDCPIRQQAFTGSVTFTNPGILYPHWFGDIDGTADDVQLNLVMTIAETSSCAVRIPIQDYDISDTVQIGATGNIFDVAMISSTFQHSNGARFNWSGGNNSAVVEILLCTSRSFVSGISVLNDNSATGLKGFFFRETDGVYAGTVYREINADYLYAEDCEVGVQIGDLTNDGSSTNFNNCRWRHIFTKNCDQGVVYDSLNSDVNTLENLWCMQAQGTPATEPYQVGILACGNTLVWNGGFVRGESVVNGPTNAIIYITGSGVTMRDVNVEGNATIKQLYINNTGGRGRTIIENFKSPDDARDTSDNDIAIEVTTTAGASFTNCKFSGNVECNGPTDAYGNTFTSNTYDFLTDSGKEYRANHPGTRYGFGVNINAEGKEFLDALNVNELVINDYVMKDTAAKTVGGAIVLLATNLLNGLIDSDPAGNVNWTLDTAANIVAAINNPEVGYTFECLLHNDATPGSGEIVTIVTAAGVTLHGSTDTLTEGTNNTGKLVIRLTNVTAGTEAVDVFILTGI
jgi:hypothetical protein